MALILVPDDVAIAAWRALMAAPQPSRGLLLEAVLVVRHRPRGMGWILAACVDMEHVVERAMVLPPPVHCDDVVRRRDEEGIVLPPKETDTGPWLQLTFAVPLERADVLDGGAGICMREWASLAVLCIAE